MFGKTVVIVVLVTLVKNASLRVVETEPKPPNNSTLQNESTPLNNWTLQNETTLQNERTELDEAGNPIVNERNSEAPEAPQHEIIQYLICSELHKSSLGGDFIYLSDSIIVNAPNPCIMKASLIILKNNKFPGYQHAFNITGKKIIMVDNEFRGPEQNHYIVGDNVLLVNNMGGPVLHRETVIGELWQNPQHIVSCKHSHILCVRISYEKKYKHLTINTCQGHLQVHEVAGCDVTAFQNVFDGKYRVHQYAATSILVFDNESKGNPFDVILTENPPNLTYNLYPNVLSHYEAFNNLRPQTEYSLGKMSPETFDLTPMSITRFLEEVKLGSKIKRPAGAPVVTKLQEFIDDRISYGRYPS